jgi:hypothetical protein
VDPYRQSLARRYAELNDAELRRRIERDELSEIPREIALAELHSRGLALAPPPTQRTFAPPLLHRDVEFTADGFSANPYQTPRADMLDTPERSGASQIWNTLWWTYTALYTLYALRAVSMPLRQGRLLNFGVVVMLAIMALTCLGLIGWCTRRRFLWRVVWIGVAVTAWLWAGLLGLASAIVMLDGTAAPIAGYQPEWLSLAMTAAVLPLAWALSRYACDKSIW